MIIYNPGKKSFLNYDDSREEDFDLFSQEPKIEEFYIPFGPVINQTEVKAPFDEQININIFNKKLDDSFHLILNNNTDKTNQSTNFNIFQNDNNKNEIESQILTKNILWEDTEIVKVFNNIWVTSEKEKEELNKKQFLNKKRRIFGLEKIPRKKEPNKKIEPKKDNISKCINVNNNLGRKKRTEKDIRKHNKLCKDNIIVKIKGHFFQYIRDITEINSLHEEIRFIKLPYGFIADLNKKKNEELFTMKIKDILSKVPISTKNKKSDTFQNRLIINKIYEEKKETYIIQILELTFEELFIIFRHKLNNPEDKEKIREMKNKIEGLDLLGEYNDYKDVTHLIKEIKDNNEEEMDKKDLDNYIQDVKDLCCNYKKWFNDKTGRVSKKIID